ncbi:MAG: peptide ABC transporter substrate-binding protein [Rubrivivax sp.]|nr:peptide ABC transporter substrate-binding protein [Rubrivivax sp.]
MHEQDLRERLAAVREGVLPRRAFVRQMAALGVGAPLAGMLLMHAGVAAAQPGPATYRPTRRGGGGLLRLLWWQGPTLLNPHFATGQKDLDGARLFYETLADWDDEGRLVPSLAAELPSRDNGGVAADGRSVTWKLKRGVTWHDGQPFTADDVVFTWQYASNPATAAVSIGYYTDRVVEKVDSHTVRITFGQPTPFWASTFVGAGGEILPRHLFAPYTGAKSRDAPNNFKPVGTGPYRCVEFKPGDLVRGTLNPTYHGANRPHFDNVEMKGGGDAVSAARAVLQTGEFDFAWNIQVEDELVRRMEAGGKGRAVYSGGADLEFVIFNFTDPQREVDGERSSLKAPHPVLSDFAVRDALALLVDKASIEKFIYGRAGVATANYLNNPPRYRSPNTAWEFNPAKAAALLDAAGWKPGAGGIREKGGRQLKFLFQTSINAPRQKTQALIKQAALKAGVAIEVKAVVGSVFFSTDAGNPDTYGKFQADLQMFTAAGTVDPTRPMLRFASWEAATKANKWSGINLSRWRNAAYDRAFRETEVELDPVRRTALFLQMNDLVVQQRAVLPLIHRKSVAAVAGRLQAPVSGWASDLAFVRDWYRDA